ncbi:MAG: flagellar export chaperone FliS [Negativicutes bacterium]|nr:flagellar export chaperone FliS [Negativicutes bacterium]
MRQNAARSAEVYRQQQVMTATPEALTLMLYNGAIKFINESIEASKKKEYEKANTSCIKAQNIISEFRLTLKMEYEISKNLLALYNYAYDRLVEGNMNEDITKLEEAKDILSELRDAWAQAMKAVKNEKGGA